MVFLIWIEKKYWNWGGKKLGERKSTRLNILREPIVKGYATEEDYLKFVEYISNPKVASVVHTMNYGGIYKCCEYINNYIEGAKSILDIGCNIGYGTTWFSLNQKFTFYWLRCVFKFNKNCKNVFKEIEG